MDHVVSADGTRIAYDRHGACPAALLMAQITGPDAIGLGSPATVSPPRRERSSTRWTIAEIRRVRQAAPVASAGGDDPSIPQ